MTFYLFLGAILIALAGLSGCASLNAEKRAPMIGQTVDVDGHRMHVLTGGPKDSEKPPVVLIHGASVNLRDMKIALGDRLSEDRFVMMIDRPGRGYSERPDKGYDLDTQSALIKGAADAMGVKRPIVVGQSFGGAVALNYALNYQDEMSGLVLLAPVSHEWPGGVDWHNHVSQTPVVGFFFRRLIIPAFGAVAGKGIVEASFEPGAPPEEYYDRAGVPLLFRAKDFKSNASDIYHLKSEILEQQGRYQEISIPVAIAHGTSDETVSPEIHSKALEKQIESASLTLLPDVGHALHHTDTEVILSLVNTVSGATE